MTGNAGKKTMKEMMRFVVVGITATAIHYGVYLALQWLMNASIAYTIGYLVSFVANYLLSARYTFRKETNKKNGIGFACAHVVNYLLQMGLLNLFLYLGVSKQLAPLPVYCISVPVNYLLVRTAFTGIKHQNEHL